MLRATPAPCPYWRACGRNGQAHCHNGFSTHVVERSGNARVTAAVRLDTCSLTKVFCGWMRTVPSDAPSRAGDLGVGIPGGDQARYFCISM